MPESADGGWYLGGVFEANYIFADIWSYIRERIENAGVRHLLKKGIWSFSDRFIHYIFSLRVVSEVLEND